MSKIEVTCDFQVSKKCKGTYQASKRSARQTRKNNNGKIMCLYCSRSLKNLGRNNPNARYAIDDMLMSQIDNKEKAYLLGWIASDGSIQRNGTIAIKIKASDILLLEKLRDIVCPDLPIKKCRRNMITLSFSSKQIASDVTNYLGITYGKKSHAVNFPHSIPDKYKTAFIAGYFDGDGSIRKPEVVRQPSCKITSNSLKMLKGIGEHIGIPYSITQDRESYIISWYSNNALDFLHRIYSSTSIRLIRKYERYIKWAMWVPALSGTGNHGNLPKFRWRKANKNAHPPAKERASDSGYDLTIIELKKKVGLVEYYDTGIQIVPDYGWYFDVVPRSSIAKSGYMMANSFGVIDRTYTGNILIALIKIDPEAPDIELPMKIVQMIPRPIVHFELTEVDSLDELSQTERGQGGFGSTGIK